MSTTFNWTIDRLECFPNHNDNFMVVHRVYWRCTAYSGTKSVKITGVIPIEDSKSEAFIQYKDLTEQIVLQWCFKSENAAPSALPKIDKLDVESRLVAQLEEQKYPLSMFPSLPWDKNSTSSR